MRPKLHKRIARDLVFPVVLGTGAYKLFHLFNSAEHVIINYHGVSKDPDLKINGRHLDAELFESHLRFFSKKFNIIPLRDMFSLDSLKDSSGKPKLAITFDDGYENNFSVAAPLLERYNAPATFFIISSCVTDPDFINWPDLFDLTRAFSEKKEFMIDGKLFLNTGSQLFCESIQRSVYSYFKLKGPEREKAFSDFRKTYDADQYFGKKTDHWKMMNTDQICKIAAHPLFEIGSHTHKHYNLANIDETLAKKEMQDSKTILEELINKEVRSLAFPDGSYNASTLETAKEAGYKNILAVKFNDKNDQGQPNLRPRFSILNTSTLASNVIQLYSGKKDYWF